MTPEDEVTSEPSLPGPGTEVTITRLGDAWMDVEARPFIGNRCRVVRVTKAGLIQVALVSDPRMTHSFPRRNVEIFTTEN